jgi:hypothetical protein
VILEKGQVETEPPTRVVFRVWRAHPRSVIALFPDDVYDNYGNCMSYEHVGQHGAADYARVLRLTRPAKLAEYADLARELERIGYSLDIRTRR